MTGGVSLNLGIAIGGVAASGTGGGSPNRFRAIADTSLAAIAAAPTIGTVSGNDVPTITEGSGFGNSTLTGAAFGGTANVTALPNDARLTNLGSNAVITSAPFAQTPWNISGGSALVGGGAGWAQMFSVKNANSFDIGAYGGTSSNVIRVKINGKWSAPRLQAGAAWTKYTFPTTADRDIEVHYAGDQTICGYNVPAGGSIAAKVPTLPVWAWFDDSYVSSENFVTNGSPLYPTCSCPVKLGEAAGILDMRLLGVGGQGAATVANSKTFVDRANGGDFTRAANASVLILGNSINDWNKATTTIQANWQAIILKAMTDCPDAIIFGFSGFKTTDYNVDAAHDAAFHAAFDAVKDPKRMFNWHGDNQLVTIGGNESTWVGADRIHLTDVGVAGCVAVLKTQIVAGLTAIPA